MRVNEKQEVFQWENKAFVVEMRDIKTDEKKIQWKMSESKKVAEVLDAAADCLCHSGCILVFIRKKSH